MKKFIMVIASIFWAGAFIAGKFSIKEFPIISLVFFRFLFATILIFPIMIKREKNWRITKDDFPIFLKLGIIGMIGYHIFFFISLKFTTATNSSLIGATNPIITTILVWLLLKETIEKKHILSILLSFLGVILIVTNGNLTTLNNINVNKGDIIMLVAVLCWALYSIISKKALEKYSPLKVTSYSFLTCVLILFPFIFIENPTEYLGNISVNGWLSVLYMSIFASVCGYLIQQISIKNIGPSKTNMYINLVPVFSMILATIILGESVNFIKILAAICIISAILISNIQIKKKDQVEETEKNILK
ncbi:DMT family transporter [Romboutsia maritimum]|nr:DMT family transporter [Romboutsia maritimum]